MAATALKQPSKKAQPHPPLSPAQVWPCPAPAHAAQKTGKWALRFYLLEQAPPSCHTVLKTIPLKNLESEQEVDSGERSQRAEPASKTRGFGEGELINWGPGQCPQNRFEGPLRPCPLPHTRRGGRNHVMAHVGDCAQRGRHRGDQDGAAHS